MNFKNKKIAVIGAGVEGVSSASYLIEKGAKVTLFDEKNEDELGSERNAKIKALKVQRVFGKNYLAALSDFDYIFRSPGVRPDLPVLGEARRKGSVVTSQTKLFFDMCPAPIIGVTGTKGKGTTSALIYEILKATGKKAFLGGNIGNAALDFIDEVTTDSIVILELSSFQLIDCEKSPHIAIVLMITSEHQDWHSSKAEYVAAKKSIVKHQTKQDSVAINSDYLTSKKLGEASKASKYYFSIKKPVDRGAYIDKDFVVSVIDGWTTIVNTKDIQIPGEHNLQNVCAAVTVGGILEIPPQIISKAVTSFKGLPHRLEFVAEIDGTKFYNDSASTVPETATAAIRAFKNPKILILGGSSKKSDFTQFAGEIVKSNVKGIILIGEEARRIKDSIEKNGKFSGKIIEGLDKMEGIVSKAKEVSQSGDVVILSPACASFDMFSNYQERGDQFRKVVVSKSN
jgi:UDP-N-acetylmuramoylalanine--D-glutamate ligase